MKIEDLEGRDLEKLAARLRLTREAFGLNQKAFAERAGLQGNTYTQYETAINKPSLDAACDIADAYGLTLDWIYRGDASALPMKLGDSLRALLKTRDDL